MSVTFTKGAFREPRLRVRSNSSADHRSILPPCQCLAPPRLSTVQADTAIPLTTREVTQQGGNGGYWPQKFCMRGAPSLNAHGEACLISTSTDAQETEPERAAVGKAVTRLEWAAPAPESSASPPEVTGWSQGMQVPLCQG